MITSAGVEIRPPMGQKPCKVHPVGMHGSWVGEHPGSAVAGRNKVLPKQDGVQRWPVELHDLRVHRAPLLAFSAVQLAVGSFAWTPRRTAH